MLARRDLEHRAVVAPAKRRGTLLDAGVRPHADRLHPLVGAAIAVVVAVGERVVRVVEREPIHVDHVGVVDRDRPADALVAADERQADHRVAGDAGDVQPVIAPDVELVGNVEPHVGVGEEHRVAARGARRADGPGVGAVRWAGRGAEGDLLVRAGQPRSGVEAVEGEDVPRLEAVEHLPPDVGIAMQVVVHAVRVGLGHGADLRRRGLVLGPGEVGDAVGPDEPVVVERFLAVELGATAEGIEEERLVLRKLVLGARVGRAEHGALVGGADDMRHAPRVAVDGDGAGERLHAAELGRRGSCCCAFAARRPLTAAVGRRGAERQTGQQGDPPSVAGHERSRTPRACPREARLLLRLPWRRSPAPHVVHWMPVCS